MLLGSSGCTSGACRPGANLLRAGAGRPVVTTLAGWLVGGACALVVGLWGAGDAFASPKGPALPNVHASQVTSPAPATASGRHAEFGRLAPSPVVRKVGDWIVDAGDNNGLPFAIVDKVGARLYVFTPEGQLKGTAPVLLGVAKGDDSVPGIGERELSDMPPEVRTTPAGRFVSALGRNAGGKEVLWVDYDAAVSMHRVIDTNPKERRPHRLATPTAADNRISYGCINVPIKFFDDVVSPSFQGTNGIVYVLPEVHPLQKVFAGYRDPHAHATVARTGSSSAGSE